jgi:hypothetical protein
MLNEIWQENTLLTSFQFHARKPNGSWGSHYDVHPFLLNCESGSQGANFDSFQNLQYKSLTGWTEAPDEGREPSGKKLLPAFMKKGVITQKQIYLSKVNYTA